MSIDILEENIKNLMIENYYKRDKVMIYNDDCFNIFELLPDNSIDCVIVDLPYVQTSCRWDTPIDLKRMWEELKRICKKNSNYVFFCTTKFGYSLIKSNPRWFRYDLVWRKSRKVGFLNANKQPLRQHEMIYVFGNDDNNDLENIRNKELREYAEMIYKKIGKSKKQIYKDMKNTKLDHFFRFNSSQFALPTLETYNIMKEYYKLDIKDYQELKNMYEKQEDKTYNSQKSKGTPYKTKGKGKVGVYNTKRIDNNNKGDRHPSSVIEHEMVYVFGNNKEKKGTYNPQKTSGHKKYKSRKSSLTKSYYRDGTKEYYSLSKDNDGTRFPNTILDYNNPSKSKHRTQKPTDLIDFLVKSYTNEGDIIIDFTCGSGSTGISCIRNKRKVILVEKNKDIYDICKNRIDNYLNKDYSYDKE